MLLHFTFIFRFSVRENLKFGLGESGKSQGISDSEICTNPVLAPSGVTVSLALCYFFPYSKNVPFTKYNPPDEVGLIQKTRKSVILYKHV